jgi:hypothetical protein
VVVKSNPAAARRVAQGIFDAGGRAGVEPESAAFVQNWATASA